MKIKYALKVCLVFAVITCLLPTSFAGSKAESDDTEYFAVFMEGKKIGPVTEPCSVRRLLALTWQGHSQI